MALAEDLVLTHNPELGGDIDEAMGLIVDVLRTLPVAEAAPRTARYQNWLLGLEAELFARNKAAGASDRDNENLAAQGRPATKAETKKRAKRGAAVGENPDLASDLAKGELGPDQVDAIAAAAGETAGAAARSGELIEEIKNSSPDDARGIAKRWADEHNNPDGDAADVRHARQRGMREVSKFPTKDGCSAILIKGDDESINEIWSNMNAAARKLWRKDGGRDLARSKHPRTRKQRLFDAAHQAMIGSSGDAAASKGSSAQLHMWMALEDFLAGKHNASFADGSLVPKTVLARYMCNGTIAATVFDKNGEVLHHGREHRYATPAQVRGLIARDKGCVRCRADVSDCEAHHLIPWSAPAEGETDIEQLALVCTDCHHFIHETNQTLYRNAKGLWCLRPATAAETPAAGRPRPERAKGAASSVAAHEVRIE